MRPIDGDALAAKIAAWKSQQHSMNIDYSTGYRSALSVVEGMIAEAPAIDAIPVEWLESKRKEALREGMRPDEVEAVEMVLWMWQKEQEAR